ncbi:MAG: cupin domain-containing protein [Nannocystaceae bacterium]|nr:cupin domain-containing protein [bacterium]
MTIADRIFGRSFGWFRAPKEEWADVDEDVGFDVRKIRYGTEDVAFSDDNKYDPAKHGPPDQLRWSLTGPNGGKYILTRCVKEGGGWENPHYHQELEEHYFCILGEVKVVWVKGGKASVRQLVPGEGVAVPVGSPHVVWMSEGAETHTLAVGKPGQDWHGDDEFKQEDRDALRDMVDRLQ